MRIISKFHDYYDSALGYGIDKSIVYERKTTLHEISSVKNYIKDFSLDIGDRISLFPSINTRRLWDGYIESCFTIFFCGKIYTGIEVSVKCKSNVNIYWDNRLTGFFYDIDSLDRFIEKHSKSIVSSEGDISKLIYSSEDFFKKYNFDQLNNNHNIHFEMNSPIILIQNICPKVISNPVLSDYQFYKKIDTFTAFQELSMYISGVMGGRSPMTIDISNNDKIAKHGFDKWSFRKEPVNKSRK